MTSQNNGQESKDRLDKVLERYDLKSKELYHLLRHKDDPDKLETILSKHGLNEKELKDMLRSANVSVPKTVLLSTPKYHVKFGYFSDPHVGHEKFREDGFELMKKTFKREGVDFIVNPGDHLEGMCSIPGHIYELKDIGFNEQVKHAAQLYSSLGVPIFGIDGNHDQRYAKKNNAGVIVGEELETRVKNYTHLGQDEGDIVLPTGHTIKLYHGGDGTAYADSYKIQKLIESFSGGEKPTVVFSGHYHKSLFLARRNVFGFESGTLCGQTRFMRGKKIQAHEGFGIVDLYLPQDPTEMPRLTHEWIQLVDIDYAPKKSIKVSLSR